jgi:hypothetical protein|tara:strand:- start:1178 stop:1432 length:255 start_codon:yes stop_codon:yes gene_type:complete
MKRGMDTGTAIMIGMQPNKGGGDEEIIESSSTGYDGDEMIEEEGFEYEYSEEQLEMADELLSALKGRDQGAILDAIHGIMMSYS